MSKFLKFIVHFVILCTMLGVLALVVPPFAGIQTTIINRPDMETNLPFGSVTYSSERDTAEIAVGSTVLIKDNSGVYCYTVEEVDAEENICKVKDAKNSKAKVRSVAMKSEVPKVIFTVPALGFLLVAVQSIEGMIILGLSIVLLIILYVIAELWRKDPKKNEEDGGAGESLAQPIAPGQETAPQTSEAPAAPEAAAGADVAIKTKKELKAEEKERIRRLKEEDRRIRAEEKARRRERKKMIRTGGFIDEIPEEELYEAPKEETPAEPRGVTVTIDASRPIEPQPEAVPSAVPQETQVMPPLSNAAPETELPSEESENVEEPESIEEAENLEEPESIEEAENLEEPESVEEPENIEEPAEIKKMALPVYTAEQLERIIREKGENPEIYKDEQTGITLFDYSEMFDEEE